jgi:malonate-semialdehyde dehydrogenase (acetylating) / methylmalonate-semialdehyde dehydrogenase
MSSRNKQTFVDFPSEPLSARSLIGGEWRDGSQDPKPVVSPYNGQVLGIIRGSSIEQVNEAVRAAALAFEEWRRTPSKERSSRLLTLRSLLLRDLERFAHSAARESGKTVAEGRAEVLKGIEVLEFAIGLQDSDIGGAMDVSRGVRCEYVREPLGVTVGITPFNFPAMVPMWMIPIALAVGNAFILKPSDKVPLTPCLLGELILEAGLPRGIFSILHGGKEVVEALADHPQVSALGFVGSSPVAKSVYVRATSHGKRALCLGGAKNHMILAPDADPQVAVDGIVASFTGCAGQRCMAGSVLVAVGECDHLIKKVVDAAGRIELGRDMGALIDHSARSRLHDAIAKAEREGAKVLLDGRKVHAPAGHEHGSWLAPTVLDGVTSSMECSCVELFGPVLSVVRVKTLDEAMALERASSYGNACVVFTTNGAVADYVAHNATSGMIGVNIGVPVPREPFSFGGTKNSKFGVGDITGSGGVEFWSQRKKVTSKWALQSDKNWMS